MTTIFETFSEYDRWLTLSVNKAHNIFFDDVFALLSSTYVWVPLYILLLVMAYFVKNEKRWLWSLIFLLGVSIVVACTDLLSYRVIKPLVHRVRPCHDESLSGLIHIVDGHCGGLYGFVSSHAANSFGIATFSFLWLKQRYRFMWLLFGWATLICYSRVYLGVHYVGDVICGAIVGMAIGYVVHQLIMTKRK